MSLELPNKNWKYAEWVDYVIEHVDEVFTSKKGKMLKAYYVHVNDRALDQLIEEERSIKQGQFTKITMGYTESVSQREKKTVYWMHEKEPGLLVFFTASTKEGYEKTLRRKIQRTLGLHEMWIKPATFEKVGKYMIDVKKAGIRKFLSDRNPHDTSPSRVRDYVERHVAYRTNDYKDGVESLEEMRYMYGITPNSIDFVVNDNRLQITNEGLFHLKTVNRETFELMNEALERIRGEAKYMRDIAQGLKFEYKPIPQAASRVVLESGRIELKKELDENLAKEMVKQFSNNFTFIDVKVKSGSLIFSCTSVDRYKGSIFGVSANENTILLVPMYGTTFETFITFYRNVVELIDDKATLNKLSESIGA